MASRDDQAAERGRQIALRHVRGSSAPSDLGMAGHPHADAPAEGDMQQFAATAAAHAGAWERMAEQAFAAAQADQRTSIDERLLALSLARAAARGSWERLADQAHAEQSRAQIGGEAASRWSDPDDLEAENRQLGDARRV
jgi:hypothetical protein